MSINKKINGILLTLNLEKVLATEKVTILCFPKKIDKEFKEKFKQAQEDIKKITKTVEIKYVEEGEIDYVKSIEFSPESGSNGVNSSGE